MAKKQTIFQIEEVIAERLKSLSSSTGVSMVKIVEKALLLFMEQIEQGNNTLLFASNETMPSTVDLKPPSSPTADSGRLDQMESKLKEITRKVSEVDCYTEKLGEDLMSLGGIGDRVDVLERKSYIFLNIDEDTTLEDIKQQFKEIEGDS